MEKTTTQHYRPATPEQLATFLTEKKAMLVYHLQTRWTFSDKEAEERAQEIIDEIDGTNHFVGLHMPADKPDLLLILNEFADKETVEIGAGECTPEVEAKGFDMPSWMNGFKSAMALVTVRLNPYRGK